MKARSLAIVLLAGLQIAAVIPPRPVERVPPMPPPTVTAPAWMLYDETNDVVLAGSAADEARPMASTTKVMTGLLAIESGRLDEMVTVSQRAADVGESEIGLVTGERIRLDALVRALLIRSANDAAMAVAEHLAGSVEAFVDQMNERAAELGLDETSFANPHGLDAEGHFTSPRDLIRLAREAMANPLFAEIVGLSSYRLADAPDGTQRVASATNTMLTSYRGTFGVKTGFTFQAGLVFVGGAERNGRRLYVAVMGSEGPGAHFADAATLLDHGFEDLQIVDTITRGTPFRLPARTVDPELVAQARLQSLVYLSSLEPMVVVESRPEPEPDPPQVLTADVPDPSDALGWLVGGLFGG